MKKIIYLFLAISIASCSSDDSEPTQNPISNLKVKKITQGNSITDFTYVNGSIVKSITTTPGEDSFVTEYTYNNDKMVALYSYELNTNSGAKSSEIALSYQYTGDKITTSTEISNNQTYSNTYTYENNLLKNRKEFYANNVINTDYYYEYFSNGNLKNITENNSGSTYITTFSTYDNNKNYLNLIFPKAYQLIRVTNQNNILTASYGTFVYEYNSEGYSTKISKTSGPNPQADAFIEYQ